MRGFALANCDWLGWTIAFYQVFFQQGTVALGKWCIGPQKGHIRTPGMEFFLECPGLIFLAARWYGPAVSANIFSVCSNYIFRVCQSLWVSFLYLVSISAAILFLQSWHVYFPFEFEFRGKCCVEWEHVGENSISCPLPCILLLYIEWIWTNYCKLSWNFVGAIRTTTVNCRVSFIDLYLVFPRNFRMVFLPHTNTVILLERYCGTITEPGSPVTILLNENTIIWSNALSFQECPVSSVWDVTRKDLTKNGFATHKFSPDLFVLYC